jgi:REP element-mobilizing transposase RayT
MRQLALKLPQWGGKRPGAGRKPNGRRALVSHRSRPRFEKPAAVQVTLSVAGHVWNLRSRRCFQVIETSLAEARERFGLRVIEFTVLGNHLHLVVEADSDQALSRGMQGLNIRIAKALNRLMERKGHVFADHYHSRLLRSPTELVNAIAYVLGNATHHYGESGQDRFSSRAYQSLHRQKILSHPQTWLLRSGWRRVRKVPQWLAANSWPPPWTQEHRSDPHAHRIDHGAG